VDWATPATPDTLDVNALLAAAQATVGAPVDLVPIDMPVAMSPITGRRVADNAISVEFGGRGCAVHSPTSQRPGPIAHLSCRGFAARGYPLATTATISGSCPALVEVFPHTALLTLLGDTYRVPYKIAKAARYWPKLSPLAVPAERTEGPPHQTCQLARGGVQSNFSRVQLRVV